MGNIIDFILFFICFIFLFIVLPFHLWGFKLESGKCLERIMKSMASGIFAVITVVYLLVFFKVLNTWTLVISLVFLFCLIKAIFWRQQVKENFWKHAETLGLIIQGYNRPGLVLKHWLGKKSKRLRQIIKIFSVHPVNNIILLIVCGYGFYIRSYVALNHYYYSLSDVYTHTYWVNKLLNNQPFANGMYPFGMHNSASALTLVFQMDTVTVLRFFGPTIGLFLLLSIYMFLSKIFKSKFAINAVLIIYCMTNLIDELPALRQSATLPQEFANLFLFPAVCFFFNYIKKRSKEDLLFFGICIAVISYGHFYIIIVTAVFCLCFFLVYMKRIVVNRQFLKLAATVILSLLLSFWPFVVGTIQGYPWEPSMSWALGVMNKNPEIESKEGLPEEGEGISNQGVQMTEEEFYSLSYDDRVNSLIGLPSNEKFKLNNLRRAKFTYSYHILAEPAWTDFYLLSLIPFLLYSIVMIIRRRKTEYGFRLLGTWFCAVVLTSMLFFRYLGLPQILDVYRLELFTYITSPIILCIYVEVIFSVLFKREKSKISIFVSILSFGVIMFYVVTQDRLKGLNQSNNVQHDGAVIAYYKVVEEFPKHMWTIVSPVQEYPAIINKGFHTELWEFVTAQSKHEEEPVFSIPTPNILFYVEKVPVSGRMLPEYVEYNNRDQPYNIDYFASISLDEITEGVSLGGYYSDPLIRTVLVSKMRKWIEEYAKYFPNEISLYYEDDLIEVYLLKQNSDNINNLILDFGYN